jgi:hypothetical protein
VRLEGPGSVAVEDARRRAAARVAGRWGLRPHPASPPATGAVPATRRGRVAARRRTTKAILEPRPIAHTCAVPRRGPGFCRVLALRRQAAVEQRLAARGAAGDWAEGRRGRAHLQDVAAGFRGRRSRWRRQVTGHADTALRAPGVAVPPPPPGRGPCPRAVVAPPPIAFVPG